MRSRFLQYFVDSKCGPERSIPRVDFGPIRTTTHRFGGVVKTDFPTSLVLPWIRVLQKFFLLCKDALGGYRGVHFFFYLPVSSPALATRRMPWAPDAHSPPHRLQPVVQLDNEEQLCSVQLWFNRCCSCVAPPYRCSLHILLPLFDSAWQGQLWSSISSAASFSAACHRCSISLHSASFLLQ